ncbi:hypothetical protein GCM10011506_05720 [Marivirga lumbricoides]|uniref:Anti-sigma factor n=1 Tax=Marivirga lumbricoides TaxID=1046115 RepID=A0ABQ1LDQ0_9BACT|nr:hypothetical protein GCM10011506_05720 [Marivirga lumbricoides]
MDKERLKYLLTLYEANALSTDEKEELEEWYESFDTKEDDAHLINLRFQGNKKGQKMYANILNRIKEKEAVTPREFYRKIPLRGAAAISLLLVASILLISNRSSLYKELITATNKTIYVPEGKMQIVSLPDGSKTWLRSGSTLTYNRFFLGGQRNLFLKGEAYFEVERNPDKPFVVQSGSMKTTVLGTSFNIKALTEFEIYEVLVRTGKVQVSDSNSILATLLPKDRLMAKHNQHILDSANVDNYLRWRNGNLRFDSSNIEEIAWYLENRFGVNIELADMKMKSCTFSGDFTGLSLSSIFKIMQEVHPFEVQYLGKENIKIISGPGCSLP